MIFLAQGVLNITFDFVDLYSNTIHLSHFLLLTTATICIAAGGYVINDYFDIKTDIVNKPKEVYITTSISKQNGLLYYVILSITGLIIGTILSFYYDNSEYTLIFLATLILLFLYSKLFQRVAILGNLITSLLVGLSLWIVFLFQDQSDDTSTIKMIFLFMIVLSVALNFIRELIKDIQDMNGDYAGGYKTLPIIIGSTRTLTVCTILCLAMVFGTALFAFTQFESNYLIIIMMILTVATPLGYIASRCWNATSIKDYKMISRMLKLLMLIGILLIPFITYTEHYA